MRCHLCGSKLETLITDLPFKISDTSIVIEDIRGTIMARVVMLMFKYIFDPALTEKLR